MTSASILLMLGLLAGGALTDPSNDVIVDRVLVPSVSRPQGEVRIVLRDGRPVVQTLLSTKVLKRVIDAIAEKERRGWPEGAEGHTDSRKYLAALETFQNAALARRDAGGPRAERRVTALIEFVDAPDHPFVAIGGAKIEAAVPDMRLVGRDAPVVLALSPAYVRRNMQLIVADSFHVTPKEAAVRLDKAGAR